MTLELMPFQRDGANLFSTSKRANSWGTLA